MASFMNYIDWSVYVLFMFQVVVKYCTGTIFDEGYDLIEELRCRSVVDV